MKTLAKTILVLVVLGAAGGAGYHYFHVWWKARNKPNYRLAAVARGEIVSVVNSTGTIQPEQRVQVGTFVSGPIEKLLANYNDEVKKGQLLAVIDPQIYEAARARDRAILATRQAEVRRVTALLEEAINQEKRALALRDMRDDYISDTELDQVKFSRQSLDAQLAIAEASVDQAEANLKNSEANVGYTEIRSPVDGIIIDRKIDEGQTLAAQFQTPELFVVAPNMKKRMLIFASVDEADIGLIRKAQRAEQKVTFTVDAYPDDLFRGKIHQVRLNPTTMQNVVTYPVVVETPNPDLKLLPGMTANLSFEVDRRENVLKIPNAALRFFPKPEQVRSEDRKLLEGATERAEKADDDTTAEGRSASQIASANERRNRRHVWIVEGEFLRAVEVVVGLSDYKYTELVSGKLKEGQKLVTSVGPKTH